MTEKKFVALTFDDGPTPGITDQVLDVLKENDIVASFFGRGQLYDGTDRAYHGRKTGVLPASVYQL